MRQFFVGLVLILGLGGGVAAVDGGKIQPRIESDSQLTVSTGGEIGPYIEPDGRQEA